MCNFLIIVHLQISFGLNVIKQSNPFDEPDTEIGFELRKELTLKDYKFEEGITFCGRFYILRFPSLLHLVTLDLPSKKTFLWASMDYDKFTFYIGGIFFVGYETGKPNQWNHICLSFNATACHVVFVKVLHYIVD